MSHPDTELLLSVEDATNWSAALVVSHLAACAECQANLRQLEVLGSFRETIPIERGFEANVAASIRRAGAAGFETAATPTTRRTSRRWQHAWPATGIFLFASAVSWLLIVLASLTTGANAGESLSMGSSVVFAMLAGAGALWHSARGLPRGHGVRQIGMLLPLLFCVLPTACMARNNSTIATLAAEDQAARRGDQVTRTDAERLRLVLELIAVSAVRTPEDQFYAALVLQHSPLTIRDNDIVAISPDNYPLAHLLATSALDRKFEPARQLVAQTIDRYLTFTTGVQRYGTNRLIDQVTGIEELVAIDRGTTDAERALYGVPPLATLLRQFPERKPRSPDQR